MPFRWDEDEVTSLINGEARKTVEAQRGERVRQREGEREKFV